MPLLEINYKDLSVTAEEFRLKALAWADAFPLAAYYYDHNIPYPHNGFRHMLAVSGGTTIDFDPASPFEDLKEAIKQKQLLCGYLGYDLKNNIEKLSSNNHDGLGFPPIVFFVPEIILYFNEVSITIESSDAYIQNILETILATPAAQPAEQEGITIQQRVPRTDYIAQVEKVRQHILEGNVYELNYCMEFFAHDVTIEPLALYLALSEVSPTPFSGYLKFNDNYLLCASPERFLKKTGTTIVSQPIKGTIKRGKTPEEDEQLRHQLRHDEKELAENMMIVDLIRNDLSRSCATGTVKVEEMFGTYGFRQVWQMISTITGTIKPENNLVDVLLGAFPMGSMTGAPKISAMQLIEELEATRRGLYSGAFGYITPDQDCDFNVVIRSIQYNAARKCLSFMVGSAITYDSDPEREYEECLLKAKAMLQILS
ncbi:anthranilate synthase component I family protein [Pontibacter sp. BT310]|uniref:Anthranilate synthase component I family protein n=1 Tax=Pontibacter populi TaxID=890055 RepID=A0ABS6XFS0_9BACT|nr:MULTISPECIES: anthranilate synthase component I family protein [Pontibacter]MBJ6119988.1 anthranilate synthase component I family protein [Pontibacter sp. BT310]MBR0572417.1 anthranilate synthase component I family protein [Microvirga sp. STS03]MBW3366841.1 anthranilate synthase component I family protein [Pontibacter populi]